jgi:hypothetical protein
LSPPLRDHIERDARLDGRRAFGKSDDEKLATAAPEFGSRVLDARRP